eukprot:CAMPEP_0119069994 /NCGR_PEP_ID=MMETSP1178-20130426/33340_1 /TAXON_ID=33656 /ORGANISM="unid sp, Strain CCMP2000" /LENGTH=177 /DNA_ID=CAMNT_0007051801 /DNA_START=22 /DNA_END=551 /DNA_ORIENTATION=+
MPVTPNHSTYRDNRHIGAIRDDNTTAGAGWRPRFGAAITLFGSEVTLGPEHVLVLVTMGVLGGIEAGIATVTLFLGYLYLKANPVIKADTVGKAERPVRRRAVREPGVLGALRYFFGPLPEGRAFVPGEAQQELPPSGGTPVEAIGTKRPAPKANPAASAVETAADKARSATAREAA